jgi:hypothetical protein
MSLLTHRHTRWVPRGPCEQNLGLAVLLLLLLLLLLLDLCLLLG